MATVPRKIASVTPVDEMTLVNRAFAVESDAFEVELQKRAIEQAEAAILDMRPRYDELTERERVELRAFEWEIERFAKANQRAADLTADPATLSKKARRRRAKVERRAASTQRESRARQLRRRAMSPAGRLSEEDAHMTALAVETMARRDAHEAKAARRRERWRAEVEAELLTGPDAPRRQSKGRVEARTPLGVERPAPTPPQEQPGLAPKSPRKSKRPRIYSTTSYIDH